MSSRPQKSEQSDFAKDGAIPIYIRDWRSFQTDPNQNRAPFDHVIAGYQQCHSTFAHPGQLHWTRAWRGLEEASYALQSLPRRSHFRDSQTEIPIDEHYLPTSHDFVPHYEFHWISCMAI